MKKVLLAMAVGVAVAATGCSTTPPTAQQAQVGYVQACAAYGAAFSAALQLRLAGKMGQAQIDQVTMLDSQITPICTGALPVDTAAAEAQIAAAVTTLTILETAK